MLEQSNKKNNRKKPVLSTPVVLQLLQNESTDRSKPKYNMWNSSSCLSACKSITCSAIVSPRRTRYLVFSSIFQDSPWTDSSNPGISLHLQAYLYSHLLWLQNKPTHEGLSTVPKIGTLRLTHELHIWRGYLYRWQKAFGRRRSHDWRNSSFQQPTSGGQSTWQCEKVRIQTKQKMVDNPGSILRLPTDKIRLNRL